MEREKAEGKALARRLVEAVEIAVEDGADGGGLRAEPALELEDLHAADGGEEDALAGGEDLLKDAVGAAPASEKGGAEGLREFAPVDARKELWSVLGEDLADDGEVRWERGEGDGNAGPGEDDGVEKSGVEGGVEVAFVLGLDDGDRLGGSSFGVSS